MEEDDGWVINVEGMIDKDRALIATSNMASIASGDSNSMGASLGLGFANFTLIGAEAEAWVFLF